MNKPLSAIGVLAAVVLLLSACAAPTPTAGPAVTKTQAQAQATVRPTQTPTPTVSPSPTVKPPEFDEDAALLTAFFTALSQHDLETYGSYYTNGPIMEAYTSGNRELYGHGDYIRNDYLKWEMLPYEAVGILGIPIWEKNIRTIKDITVVAQIEDSYWNNSPPYSPLMENAKLYLVRCYITAKYEDYAVTTTGRDGVDYFMVYLQTYKGRREITAVEPVEKSLLWTDKYEKNREIARQYLYEECIWHIVHNNDKIPNPEWTLGPDPITSESYENSALSPRRE